MCWTLSSPNFLSSEGWVLEVLRVSRMTCKLRPPHTRMHAHTRPRTHVPATIRAESVNPGPSAQAKSVSRPGLFLPPLRQGDLWAQLLRQGLPLLRSASLYSYAWILDAPAALTDTF